LNYVAFTCSSGGAAHMRPSRTFSEALDPGNSREAAPNPPRRRQLRTALESDAELIALHQLVRQAEQRLALVRERRSGLANERGLRDGRIGGRVDWRTKQQPPGGVRVANPRYPLKRTLEWTHHDVALFVAVKMCYGDPRDIADACKCVHASARSLSFSGACVCE
jgi:hypothetical protein